MIEGCVNHKEHPACWFCIIFSFLVGVLTAGGLIGLALAISSS